MPWLSPIHLHQLKVVSSLLDQPQLTISIEQAPKSNENWVFLFPHISVVQPVQKFYPSVHAAHHAISIAFCKPRLLTGISLKAR